MTFHLIRPEAHQQGLTVVGIPVTPSQTNMKVSPLTNINDYKQILVILLCCYGPSWRATLPDKTQALDTQTKQSATYLWSFLFCCCGCAAVLSFHDLISNIWKKLKHLDVDTNKPHPKKHSGKAISGYNMTPRSLWASQPQPLLFLSAPG